VIIIASNWEVPDTGPPIGFSRRCDRPGMGVPWAIGVGFLHDNAVRPPTLREKIDTSLGERSNRCGHTRTEAGIKTANETNQPEILRGLN
jgi:hypothetical protein